MKSRGWKIRSRHWVATLGLLACSGCASYQDWQHSSVNHARARWSWWTDDSISGTGWVYSDFASGYRAGWYSVAMGGDGRPPAVPPREYWKPWYQSADGAQAIQNWFEGFQSGAIAAEAAGVCHYTLVPSQGAIQPPDNGFVHHVESEASVHRPVIVDTPGNRPETVAPPRREPVAPQFPSNAPPMPPAPPSAAPRTAPPVAAPPKPPVSSAPLPGTFDSQTSVTPPSLPIDPVKAIEPPKPVDPPKPTMYTAIAETGRTRVVPFKPVSQTTTTTTAATKSDTTDSATASVVPRVKAQTVSVSSATHANNRTLPTGMAPLPPVTNSSTRVVPVAFHGRSGSKQSGDATCAAKIERTSQVVSLPPVETPTLAVQRAPAPEPPTLQAMRYDRRQDEVSR